MATDKAALSPLAFQTANVFAPTPHAGNQAAVVIFPESDPRSTDDEYYRSIAADFNLAETAFVVEKDIEAAVPRYGLRWFTPEVEVPLCGHATLAAATALFHRHPSATEVNFDTRWRGTLVARLQGKEHDGRALRVAISIPLPPDGVELASEDHAAQARDVAKSAAGIAEDKVVRVAQFEFGTIVQVSPDVDIGALKVDKAKIAPNFPKLFIVTQVIGASPTSSAEAPSVRINTRVFCPGIGIPEDPVTGYAHAALCSYYLGGVGRASVEEAIPGVDASKAALDARQLSARGGALTCSIVEGRAQLAGLGWRTSKGELDVFP